MTADGCLFEITPPLPPPRPADGTHECPANRCTRRVPKPMLMCPDDWRLVPAALKDAVWAEWQNGLGEGTPEHHMAITDAINAVNERKHSA